MPITLYHKIKITIKDSFNNNKIGVDKPKSTTSQAQFVKIKTKSETQKVLRKNG